MKTTETNNTNLKKLPISSIIILFIIYGVTVNTLYAQPQPTFNIKVKNFVLGDTLGGHGNVLFFDIFIQHTNPAASGPFELASSQYFFNFNPAIANGGTLSYRIVPGSSQFTNPNMIPRNPAIVGSRLDLIANALQGAGNGQVIDTTIPEVRVVKMKLATTTGTFDSVPLNLRFRNVLNGNPYTKVFAYIGVTNTEITNNGTYIIEPDPFAITLNLKMYIEGFYNAVSNTQTGDTIIVYLRNITNPYAIVDSAKAFINSDGNATLSFINAASGTYHIVFKHRNSIETWSKTGGVVLTRNASTSYDFTTAQTQAFGNNMKQVDTSPVRFAIYSGDVNQSGAINLNDIIEVSNNSSNFVNGYVSTDVTGDNRTNLADILLTYNNSVNFVVKITP